LRFVKQRKSRDGRVAGGEILTASRLHLVGHRERDHIQRRQEAFDSSRRVFVKAARDEGLKSKGEFGAEAHVFLDLKLGSTTFTLGTARQPTCGFRYHSQAASHYEVKYAAWAANLPRTAGLSWHAVHRSATDAGRYTVQQSQQWRSDSKVASASNTWWFRPRITSAGAQSRFMVKNDTCSDIAAESWTDL